jgi:SsrA-binding protein
MSITENRKAFHDYFIEERYEAGIALLGWEVKSIRAGRANLQEAYVTVRGAEVYLVGAHMSPLPTASTHVTPDPVRNRKLLLHGEEIAQADRPGGARRLHAGHRSNLHFTKGRVKARASAWRRARSSSTSATPPASANGSASSSES